jgi:hypothetical protein
MNWLNRLLGHRARTHTIAAPRPALRSSRPALEMLEDRVQPSATSVIAANFHGSPPAGSKVWFHSSFKAIGVGSQTATIRVVNSAIDFTVKATKYHLEVPNATVVFSPTVTKATTSFDVAAKTWNTTVPSSFKGDVFLTGVAWTAPAKLKGEIKNLKWKAEFESDTAGVKVGWHWSAEAYKTLSSDYNALGVKPAEGRQVTAYRNADPAGTPEAFKNQLVVGRGWCGHRHVGTHSGVKKVKPDVVAPPQQSTSLSGRVVLDDTITVSPLEGVSIHLTGVDDQGQVVDLTVQTAADGTYSFGTLRAGVYAVAVQTPDNTVNFSAATGSLGGDSTTGEVANIHVANNSVGFGYDFVLHPGVPNS